MSDFDRTRRPAAGEIRDFDFPEVERRTLPNGLDLRVARMSRLPMVSLNLFFRAGEGGLGDERAGLAVLVGDALEGGTAKLSGSDLAEALERIGARIGVATGWEGTSVKLSCLADRLAEALPLVAQMVVEPDFPEDEVARVREQALALLRQRAMDPDSLAADSALPRTFAAGHPYARTQTGTEASISGVGRETMRGYADGWYRPEDGGIVLVGDLDMDEVEALCARHLGAWTGAPPRTESGMPEAATRARRVLIVDRPGSVQSAIRVGHIGVGRDTDDYFPLAIGNLILGGSFTSRLNLNLRERNGFTYGVRSRFSLRSQPGPFGISTAVGTEVTADAVREILAETEGLIEEGATEEEVATARDYSAGLFGLQLETAGQVASRIAQELVFGLPDGYYRGYRESVRAVTKPEVDAALRRHVRPSEAQIVVVGAAAEIRGPLEALGVGPVEVVGDG